MTSGKVIVTVLVAALALSACSRKSTGDPGPDEFSVLPVNSLSEPANYSDLPAPRSDGASRAEASPIGQAIALLGGDPSQPTRMLGSTETTGTGMLGRIFGRKSGGDILDARAEAARLAGLGIPVAAGN